MTIVLGVLAVLANGLLAGLSLDRSLVAMPAWRRVGIQAWATFSREADLRRGLVLYPLLGIGAPILSIGTAASFWAGTAQPVAALGSLAGAAALSIAHVLATTQAAPNMAKVGHLDDADGLWEAFGAFERWQAVRATLQVLTFGASVWALVVLASAA
jgi:hypothetical protein